MYLESLFIVIRRWRLSVPVVLIAAVAAVATFVSVPPSYEDSAQVLLLSSPRVPGQKYSGNPFLGMSSTLVATADVVRLRVGSPDVSQRLTDRGATAGYEVVLDDSTAAPVLLVTTHHHDSESARRTLLAVVAEIAVVLDELQESSGAPKETWVNTRMVSSLPAPVRILNDSLRPAIAAGALIFAVGVLLLFMAEGRRRRKVHRSGSGQVAGAHDQVGPGHEVDEFVGSTGSSQPSALEPRIDLVETGAADELEHPGGTRPVRPDGESGSGLPAGSDRPAQRHGPQARLAEDTLPGGLFLESGGSVRPARPMRPARESRPAGVWRPGPGSAGRQL